MTKPNYTPDYKRILMGLGYGVKKIGSVWEIQNPKDPHPLSDIVYLYETDVWEELFRRVKEHDVALECDDFFRDKGYFTALYADATFCYTVAKTDDEDIDITSEMISANAPTRGLAIFNVFEQYLNRQ